jgi:hypothetical protein
MGSELTGDYGSLAEAAGEVEPKSPGWVPGKDFDPDDPEEMQTMELVWERERESALAAKDREIAGLRAKLEQYGGGNSGDYTDVY